MKINHLTIGGIIIFFQIALISGCAVNNAKQSHISDNTDSLKAGLINEAPGSYKIADDKEAITIPFGYYGMNLLINGRMNGKKVKFLIDNGVLWDQVWFYNGEVDSINLRYKNDEKIPLSGIGEDGGSVMLEGNNIDIDFGDIRFIGQPCLISPPEAGFNSYFPGINGQVSSLLFKHFVVKFDFDENVIVLTKPGKFKYTGQGQAVPMHKNKNGSYSVLFSLQMTDLKMHNINLDIDLGTVSPLYLIENKKNNILIPKNSEKKLLGYGASGAIYGFQGYIQIVNIGRYSLKNVPAEFVEEKANDDSTVVETGTFGLPLMKKFNITFDYFNQIMYFEPNKSFSNPFE